MFNYDEERRAHLWVAMFGLLLLAPAVWYWVWIWIADPVRPSDVYVAFARLAEVSLKQVENDGSSHLTITIPDNSVWRRIRHNWGDPGYIILASPPGQKHQLYCLNDLGLGVDVEENGRPINLETAEYPPYGYSANCKPAGLQFRAPPGATLRINIIAKDRFTGVANLIIEPYWTANTKDHLVGVSFQADLHIRTVVNTLAVVGLATISLTALLLFLRRT